MTRPTKTWVAAAALALLSGCASLSPDGGLADVSALSAGKTAGVNATLVRSETDSSRAAISELLQKPLTAESAVRIALLNNPGLHASLATLGISDAERVRVATLPNPHLAIGRLTEGSTLEIERALTFNVIGLITLPWKARYQSRQHELAKLQAAQDVVKLAANTRKAWINAVAAEQSARYMADAKAAAEASGELARRLARVGNWSKLQQAREQVFVADATAQLARSRQNAFAEREKLIRLLGLWGTQTQFTLADRLPDLPSGVTDMEDVEARALRERLDLRSAVAESGYVAQSLGLTQATGFISALDLSYRRNTIFDNAAGTQATKRGWELDVPLPIFDWGSAGNARAQALYMQSVARVREAAIKARSEAREAYHGWRTAYDLARHYQDEVVPLRRFISDEMLLRYNGMLSSAFDLLADTRQSIAAVNASIEARRDFWLADTDLQTALTGLSPGPASSMQPGAMPGTTEAKGH